MVAPRPNYGITRIDQPEKKNHGFYVRITHQDQTHQQYFPDESSGGKANALKLAKEYRDELLAQMPRYKQEMAARKERKALRSGVEGVTHVVSKVGADKQYEYWQAAWREESGRERTAKFSISRYGNDKAMDMAIKARAKAIRIRERAVALPSDQRRLDNVDPGAAERLCAAGVENFQQFADPDTPSLAEKEVLAGKAERGTTMNTRTATCVTCRHWYRGDDQHDSDLGECRRYPPEWPETSRDGWCGEINVDKTEMFLEVWRGIMALVTCAAALQIFNLLSKDKPLNAAFCLMGGIFGLVWWIKAARALKKWRKQCPNPVL